MKDAELKDTLNERRESLGLSYVDIQKCTQLGYNTVRRVFDSPFNCRLSSVLGVLRTMGCELVFSVENRIGDELEK